MDEGRCYTCSKGTEWRGVILCDCEPWTQVLPYTAKCPFAEYKPKGEGDE